MVHIRMKYGMKTWDDILKAEGQSTQSKSQGVRRTA
jgi:hypothetical protein